MNINQENTFKYLRYFYTATDTPFPIFSWCGEFVCKKDFLISRSRPKFSMALYTLEGEGTLILGDKQYALKKNTMAILCGEDDYSYFPLAEGWRFRFVHFDGEKSRGIFHKIVDMQSPVFPFFDFDGLFDGILDCAKNKNDEKCASELTFKLLNSLYFGAKERVENPIVFKAKEYIKNNLAAHLLVDELARCAGLSRPYFTEVFAREAGISPARFIAQERIKRAKELLFTTDLSVSEIASSVGYDDVASFIRMFKNHEGETPLSLRKGNPFG